jgi:hypothetical protein
MKIDALKKIIKESVREAIKEEIKDILMEAIRTSRSPINEQQSYQNYPSSPKIPTEDLRSKYAGMMDMPFSRGTSDTLEFNTGNVYRPMSAASGVEGSLPPGEVDMSQISKLLNS